MSIENYVNQIVKSLNLIWWSQFKYKFNLAIMKTELSYYQMKVIYNNYSQLSKEKKKKKRKATLLHFPVKIMK